MVDEMKNECVIVVEPGDDTHKERLTELFCKQDSYLNSLKEPYRCPWGLEAASEAASSYWQGAQESKCIILLVENDDGFVIGFSIVRFAIKRNGEKSVCIEELFVEDVYRGQGYGTALLNKVRDIAILHGWDTAYIANYQRNEEAARFFERFGMVPVETVYYMPLA